MEISLRLFKPTSLKEAYELAKVQDVLWSKKNSGEQWGRFSGIDEGVQQKVVARTLVNANLTPSQPKDGLLAHPSSGDKMIPAKSSKRLSSQDVDDRRRKGLCF